MSDNKQRVQDRLNNVFSRGMNSSGVLKNPQFPPSNVFLEIHFFYLSLLIGAKVDIKIYFVVVTLL